MQLSTEQALVQAVDAHRAGKLQEAEVLYRAILQSEPLHPDANHNLGVLAVAVNQPEAALPLFKTALEGNASQGQFWLSYIDALMKVNQFDVAKQVLTQGRREGLSGERVDTLETQLKAVLVVHSTEPSPVQKKPTYTQLRKKATEDKVKSTSASPSPVDLNALLGHYQAGKYDLAEKLAIALTQKFPSHQFGWKVLGALFKLTGRLEESLTANYKAVEISPKDAEALYNLGITLHELERFKDAETSYKKAIALAPGSAETHYNLGLTLQGLDRHEEAQTSYKKAIAIKPEYAQAHYNLALTLQGMGRLEEAETSYKTAIAIAPDYAEAYSNLGVVLQELGRLDEALARLQQAIEIQVDFSEALLNIALLHIFLNKPEESVQYFEKVIKIDKGIFNLKSNLSLAILDYLNNDFQHTALRLNNAEHILENESKLLANDVKYYVYLKHLLAWHQEQKIAPDDSLAQVVHVIGESHSLSSQGIEVLSSSERFICKAHWIEGCKQWHLSNDRPNKYKEKFERVIHSLETGTKILLAIGEIDCRLDEGILKHVKNHPENSKSELIESTIRNYLNYVHQLTHAKSIQVLVQGVPCPNIDSKYLEKNDLESLIYLIKEFNSVLRTRSRHMNFEYLDVHGLTDRGDGISNGIWHIDQNHLSPAGMIEAWRRHLANE